MSSANIETTAVSQWGAALSYGPMFSLTSLLLYALLKKLYNWKVNRIPDWETRSAIPTRIVAISVAKWAITTKSEYILHCPDPPQKSICTSKWYTQNLARPKGPQTLVLHYFSNFDHVSQIEISILWLLWILVENLLAPCFLTSRKKEYVSCYQNGFSELDLVWMFMTMVIFSPIVGLVAPCHLAILLEKSIIMLTFK